MISQPSCCVNDSKRRYMTSSSRPKISGSAGHMTYRLLLDFYTAQPRRASLLKSCTTSTPGSRQDGFCSPVSCMGRALRDPLSAELSTTVLPHRPCSSSQAQHYRDNTDSGSDCRKQYTHPSHTKQMAAGPAKGRHAPEAQTMLSVVWLTKCAS